MGLQSQLIDLGSALIPGPSWAYYPLWSTKGGQFAKDQGSVSTGYSDRPVARAIKIKHAGLNLTGQSSKLQAV